MKEGRLILERHSGVHRNETGNASDTKRNGTRQRLTRPCSPLDKLFEGSICGEADSGVGPLAHHLEESSVYVGTRCEEQAYHREKPTIYPKNTLLFDNRGCSMYQATVLGAGSLSVINEFGPVACSVQPRV